MSTVPNKSFNIKESFKYFLIILSIFLISLLLPGNRNSNDELVIGSTWQQDDLIAHQDFKVEKRESELNKFKKDVGPKFKTLLKYQEAIVHDLGAELFENSQNLLTNGVKVKSLMDFIYEIPVRQNLPAEGDYYFINEGELQAFNAIGTQSLDEAKIKFKRDLIGNDLYEEGVENVLVPNYVLDEEYQEKAFQDAITAFANDVAFYPKDSSIVSRGDVITLDNKFAIESYKNSQSSLKLLSGINMLQYLGYLILTTLIILILILFLKELYPTLYNSIRGVAFVLFWPVLFGILIWLVKGIPSLSPYMLPFCIVPIVVKNFFSDRLALFIHIVVVLIASYLTGLGYEFTFIQILAGVVTVLLISETRKWNKFFISIALILGTYALGFLGINLIQSGDDLVSDLPIFAWLIVNGLLLLLAYPFIPIIEKIFGFTSSISLVELSDMNNPLLKDLSTRAPGTLQHSLQVANLAEAATEAIGGNSVLVRTAALYHDIGKLSNPQYFIENNSGNNLHNELNDNFESARIIISHVTEGVKMAKKAKLPKEIIDIIETHHGDSRVEYFYRNQKNENPDREFDESIFRYPGPKPKTKEQTLIMIADTIEAACKSLKNPNESELTEFVDKIVNFKIDNGQLEDSNLSFEELKKATNVMKTMLKSIYHVRLEYPEDKS